MAEGGGARSPGSDALLTACFVDTHCHLDRYPAPHDELARAVSAGVVIVAVTELPSRFQREEMRHRNTKTVRAAIGIHPLAAPLVTPMEMSLFRQLVDRTDYVGEVGLDGSAEGKPSLARQREVFNTVLAHHAITSKVLTVHSRRAESEVVEALAGVGARAILHWYSGPLGALERALDAGLYFSVNPAMLTTKSGQRVLAAVPPERILTETDGPYTKREGRQARPDDLPWLVEQLAVRWQVDAEQARHQVFENMTRLFKSRADATA